MTIYAVVNSKGGVGKTTIAVHLATLFAQNSRTLLIDGDPQGSAASWAAWRRDYAPDAPSPTTTCLHEKAILNEGRPLAKGFEHAVVDAGGRDTAGLRSALLLAQRAIIPVGASQLDAAALTDILTLVDMARDYNPKLTTCVLLNRIDSRTKDTAEMLDYLHTKPLTVTKATLAERVAYRRSVGEGQTVWEYGKDKNATAEVEAMLAEVTTHEG